MLIAHENGAILLLEKGNRIELYSASTGDWNGLSMPLYDVEFSGLGLEDMIDTLQNHCKLDEKSMGLAKEYIEGVLRKYA